jgi:plasmid stabilization system protein ParE
MKVRTTLPAFAELERILTYLDVQSPSAARKVRARIEAVTRVLAKNPYAGRRTRRGYRIPTWPYHYLIFYEPVGDQITIHAIRHDARHPGTMPDA